MLVSGQGICFCGMKMVTVWLWLHFLHLAISIMDLVSYVVVGEGWAFYSLLGYVVLSLTLGKRFFCLFSLQYDLDPQPSHVVQVCQAPPFQVMLEFPRLASVVRTCPHL